MAEQSEVKVVRIVNLGDTFTHHQTLMDFIDQIVPLEGKIQNVYIKKDNKLELVYAYVIFEESCDASETVRCLNGHIYNNINKLDVALIAPGLSYKSYGNTLMDNIFKDLLEKRREGRTSLETTRIDREREHRERERRKRVLRECIEERERMHRQTENRNNDIHHKDGIYHHLSGFPSVSRMTKKKYR